MSNTRFRLSAWLVWSILAIGLLSTDAAAASGYTALYVFGGTLEDVGNYANPIGLERDYYLPGRASNGPVYVEYVADSLGVGPLRRSEDGGTDYAWFAAFIDTTWRGTKTRNIRVQVEQYIAGLGALDSADPDALYLLGCGWGEAADCTGGSGGSGLADFETYTARARMKANIVLGLVDSLAGVGARHFALVQMFDFSSVGYWGTTVEAQSKACAAYNEALTKGGDGREELNVMIVSVGEWVALARRNYLNTQTSYEYYVYGAEGSSHPDQHFLLDDTYSFVSGAAHRFLASVVLAAINRPPLPVNPIEDIDLVVGTESWRHGLITSPPVFVDDDGDIMKFAASSSDTSVASVSISGTTLEVIPRNAGVVTVQVSATDPRGRVARSDFQVTVSAGGFGASLALDAGGGTPPAGAMSGVRGDWSCTLDIQLSSIKGIEGATVRVSYDPTQLSYDGFVQTSVFSSVSATDSSGVVTITTGPLEAPTTSASGHLCGLRFTTKSTFSGTTLQVTGGSVSRNGHEEELDESVVARLSSRNCDFNGDGEVGFVDFLSFARGFGASQADGNYDARYDLDGNDRIDFSDFLKFAQDYGTPVVQ